MCDIACIDFGLKYLKKSEVENRRVIEIGSYNVNGSLKPDIIKYLPEKYLGIDIAPGPNVDEVCDVYDVIKKYGPSSFDVVVSTEMLEHVEFWKVAISNMKNLTSENGCIILTTRSKGFRLHNYPHDFWRFEVEDMKNIFSDFIIEKIDSDPCAPGVFIKATKPENFIENDLSNYEVYRMEK